MVRMQYLGTAHRTIARIGIDPPIITFTVFAAPFASMKHAKNRTDDSAPLPRQDYKNVMRT